MILSVQYLLSKFTTGGKLTAGSCIEADHLQTIHVDMASMWEAASTLRTLSFFWDAPALPRTPLVPPGFAAPDSVGVSHLSTCLSASIYISYFTAHFSYHHAKSASSEEEPQNHPDFPLAPSQCQKNGTSPSATRLPSNGVPLEVPLGLSSSRASSSRA